MTQSERSRIVFRAAVGAVATIGLLAGMGDALAARRKKKRVKAAKVQNLQTPLGLQGKRGAGNNVVSPFSLVDKSRRKSDIDAEFGYDVNGDGIIADGSDPNLSSEYFPATEDRRDPRNTRKNKKPQLFTTAGDIGSSQAFVWNSSADVGTAHYPTLQILHTPQGRPVPDPDNEGSYLFDDAQAGVKVRLRARAKKGSAVGEWVYSDAFALNNNTPPSMTIDEIIPNTTSTPTASDEVVEILWTAFDDDSEDKNGNGVLDPLDLEDENGNGVLDAENVAVAFDYWRVPEGVDPSTFTQAQLEALIWQPCTRADGIGDPDDGVPSAPEGVGRQNTFAWDSLADVGTVKAQFILRAKPFDSKKESGEVVYFTDGFELDNHTVFNHPNANADLPAGRLGTASVNLVPGLSRSDPLYEPPLQSFLVTGGSAVANGPGTTYLALVAVNTETAETTTANAIAYTTLSDARSYHTATLLDDGRVLLAGGFDASGSAIASTEIYDPVSHTVTPGPQLLTARAMHSAVRLPSGDVLFVGGMGQGGNALASAEIYQFTPFGEPTEPCVALPDLAVAQHSTHAVLLPNQKVLVTGGISASGSAVQTAQVLDTLNDANGDPLTKEPDWFMVDSMSEARMLASATALTSGHVLFAGGSASPSKASMELFNWETEQFETITAAMPDGGRSDHACALLGNGWVLLAGGTTDPASGSIVAAADVFELGARDDASGTWDGQFMPVNGDMQYPRRGAEALAINNGRVFIVGGENATGSALSELEVYTPRGGLNARPSTRTDLESRQQSWAYGAPIVYRVTDAEKDDVRVIVQWSDNGGTTWNAAAPQMSTIGGDLAEPTAAVTSGDSDDESLAISPRSYPESDHQYIWAMTKDIPRPPQGGSAGPYIFRTTPFGAVQGSAAQSVPVTVLYNTKVIPTILPLESRDGVQSAQQGGDIHIWVHFRDIDGSVVPGPGDDAEAVFEYAVDANGDGTINDGAEFWNAMSRSGAAKFPANREDNLLTGITTYSEPFDQSGMDFGDRPVNQGWAMFPWDSVFDLGAPASSRGDVHIRVRPFDNLTGTEPDEGFTASLFNEAGQPESFRLIRDPEALWLSQFRPAGGNDQDVALGEPLEFHFNGLVDPTTVNDDTIQIRLGSTRLLGVFTVAQDVTAFETLVTFFPRLNSTVLDQLVYSEQDNPTVLFPFNDYSVFIPGYHAEDDFPMTVETLQPDLSAFPSQPDETFRLVQNVEIDSGFRTGAGNYDDGTPAAVQEPTPVGGSSLDPDDLATNGVTLMYSKGLDLTTVKSPNVTFTVDNAGGSSAARYSNPVIPTQMTITNSQDPTTGLTTSMVQIVPLTHLPSGRTLSLVTNSGLLGANGRPVEATDVDYTVNGYGTKNVDGLEDFEDDDFEDTSISNAASWGRDLCNPGALTGLQGGGAAPQGGSDLLVQNGQVATITNTVNDYNNITVEKGGTLRIRASAAVTIRATGNITIAGTVDFRGEGGWSKIAGNTSSSSYTTIGPRGTRADIKGGSAYNGGGDGGDATHSGTNRTAGKDGEGSEYGQGGRVASTASRYYYGAGGGAGGGHGAAGLPGGLAAAYTSSSSSTTSYGNFSVPGGTTGDPDMVTGPSAGSGGGGGGSSNYYPSTTPWYHTGGGGGAGAGALTFVCDGVFDLKASGLIDGRGGDGGGSVQYGGAGGGGSGGGLKVTAGSGSKLDGVVDLRGGRGGPRMVGYYYDSYNRYARYVGTARFGGDGGPGRFVIQSPAYSDVDNVRVRGQLLVQKIDTLPATNLAVTTVPSAFSNGGSVDYGTATAVRYASLSVPAGRAVDITGTKALTIYVDDDIDIQGTLRINGKEAQYGFNTSRPAGFSGSGPTRSYHYSSSGTANVPAGYVGGVGTLGGGNGGNPYLTSGTQARANAFNREATDGFGPAKGFHAIATNPGYNYSYSSGSYSNSQFQFVGDAGGGGGGNATEGNDGWAPYGQGARYAYLGAVNDSSGQGHSEADRKTYIDNGGIMLDATNISPANLASFVGSGGGGGNSGAYKYAYQSGSYTYGYFYSAVAGSAGSGAGGMALVSQKTVSVSGTIEAKGGHGNPSGDAYYFRYTHGGGGAGSGGTVMLIGDMVDIDPVTDITNAASGATFDMRGGTGGSWRQFYRNNSTTSRYPHYDTAGNFGGDGGFGRLVVQYTTSVNDGATLFNRGGMEHVAFEDIYRQYSVFAGSARSQCLGGNDGTNFRSTWYDLGSVAPIVNGLAPDSIGPNTTYTLQGEGAQSHPHNPGDGSGEPDSNNTSGLQTPSSAMLDGWRWFRFDGTLSRTSSDPTEPPPVLDDMEFPYVTDDVQ